MGTAHFVLLYQPVDLGLKNCSNNFVIFFSGFHLIQFIKFYHSYFELHTLLKFRIDFDRMVDRTKYFDKSDQKELEIF